MTFARLIRGSAATILDLMLLPFSVIPRPA